MSRKDTIQELISDINKKYKPEHSNRPIAIRGDEMEHINFIPCSSYALGYVFGTGGWFEGKLHELVGPEGAGKTTIAYSALKDIYNYYEGERSVAVIDLEHRFDPSWAQTIGLDVDESLIVLQPPTAESATDMMHDLIKSGEVCAIMFDSIGQATPEKETQKFDDQATMYGGNAKVMARNVRTVAPLANLYNTTCIYLNQVRADMSGYNQIITPGGHAVKHGMSMRLYIRRGKEKYYDKTPAGDVQVGFSMVFRNLKNSFGPPFKEQWTDFYFQPSKWLDHVGFDTDRELQRLGIITGVIQRGGPWYSFQDIKEKGRDEFFKAIREEGLEEILKEEVMDSLGASHTYNEDDLDEDLRKPEIADGDNLSALLGTLSVD